MRDHFRQVRMKLIETERHERTRRIERAAFAWLAAHLREQAREPGRDRIVAGLYAPMPGEVDLLGFAARLRDEGVAIAFPRILPGRQMVFCLVDRYESMLPGPYGILAPTDEHPVLPKQAISAIFVPGLAFTRAGVRLGYGGGYYDRYFAGIGEPPWRIGVCYEDQVANELPESPHDVRMHWLLTDGGMVRCQTRV
ncbi:5-formyltetrahydrofolate cyclo-ligase [Alicyclobacillus acidiphilus]|uniref:5-formyltetrahydrofolate cyclo-ligase n=1 Tax=Alicyclobacillus acidiphilus TaxID=182455 RepID=UPI002481508E|nr:5-formyltetrahydrofolate cyclo-ligase [Alicyclobacillus acidiphilus]